MIPNLTIEDDKGKHFEEVSNGEGVPQWVGYLREVKPADIVQGNIVFDAPPAHYKLKLADETGDEIALIDLPLVRRRDARNSTPPGENSKRRMEQSESPAALELKYVGVAAAFSSFQTATSLPRAEGARRR